VANRWGIPREVEVRLRRTFKACAYCSCRMKAHRSLIGVARDKATFEHLNRNGPFYWSDDLQEKDVVIVCARCNSSRGRRRLVEWFDSPYCRTRRITARTVSRQVRQYLRTLAAKRWRGTDVRMVNRWLTANGLACMPWSRLTSGCS
jgi:hypothetical protein